ncbi:MAG: hypothetical protein ACJARX_000919 [Psychroserpens sp.]|jgi:hypothetical protein
MGLTPSIKGSIFIFVLDETLQTIDLVTKASNLYIIRDKNYYYTNSKNY